MAGEDGGLDDMPEPLRRAECRPGRTPMTPGTEAYAYAVAKANLLLSRHRDSPMAAV